MATENRVDEAIRRSVMQTSCVYLRHLTRDEHHRLVALCEDWTEGAGVDGNVCDYWGNDDGSDWRIEGTRD